ncbi:Asp23/Gls24 family envelope stress response protein [Marinococcus luteus]|uniref:Asp23/Gls24 family envelope stress response protein n=1 Tax=Marinococcus luteus TaxID=1122204 RepID=UPI002ACC6A9F|nr:Asp23/Gls24 family envelope stress response protein [Marinococcus luteus]MDZ5781769.1 Asp23/Gls24 family envelope stress response protein [Marinococcus luteus]
MSFEIYSSNGTVDITLEVLATAVGAAAMDCYGIVGMASRKHFKDNLSELLRRENYSRGVVVREEDGLIHIDMYIIVSYGTKISEVAHNVQRKVKYQLQKMLGLDVSAVNVYVQGVQIESASP